MEFNKDKIETFNSNFDQVSWYVLFLKDDFEENDFDFLNDESNMAN